jgi:cation diffusion facilitator family transporter
VGSLQKLSVEQLAAGSIGVGVLVLLLKGCAWLLTGSAAFYSDALETLVNVAAAALALWAVRMSAKPADADHTYGHAKIELFTAMVEGALIVCAAVLIMAHAWEAWQAPHLPDAPVRGLAINAAATVINAVWAAVLLQAGKRERSPALIADARHLVADVVTSAGIFVGVLLVVLTGRAALDPLLAAATAVYVLWSGMRMVGESANVLMDALPSPAIMERIHALVGSHAKGAIEAHDFRARRAGHASFLEFHLVVPGGMSVSEAHNICDEIEAALHAEMQGLIVTIHVEPEAKAKQEGVLVR